MYKIEIWYDESNNTNNLWLSKDGVYTTKEVVYCKQDIKYIINKAISDLELTHKSKLNKLTIYEVKCPTCRKSYRIDIENGENCKDIKCVQCLTKFDVISEEENDGN